MAQHTCEWPVSSGRLRALQHGPECANNVKLHQLLLKQLPNSVSVELSQTHAFGSWPRHPTRPFSCREQFLAILVQHIKHTQKIPKPNYTSTGTSKVQRCCRELLNHFTSETKMDTKGCFRVAIMPLQIIQK